MSRTNQTTFNGKVTSLVEASKKVGKSPMYFHAMKSNCKAKWAFLETLDKDIILAYEKEQYIIFKVKQNIDKILYELEEAKDRKHSKSAFSRYLHTKKVYNTADSFVSYCKVRNQSLTSKVGTNKLITLMRVIYHYPLFLETISTNQEIINPPPIPKHLKTLEEITKKIWEQTF